MIERGEAHVRALGFRIFRVRHLAEETGARARVQIAPTEMDHLPAIRTVMEAGLLEIGYNSVEIDPEGYRSASSPVSALSQQG